MKTTLRHRRAINKSAAPAVDWANELAESLEAVLTDEWRMSCDWGPRDDRNAITRAASQALARYRAARKE